MLRSITSDCFPTPALVQRSNDPVAQRNLRMFAHKQADAARQLHLMLTGGLHRTRSVDACVAVFERVFDAAEKWRYQLAADAPPLTGRYGAVHVERFRTPITDVNPNLFRIGEPERFTDGAVWNPITRTYTNGTETPASRTVQRFAAIVAARFADLPPKVNVVCNRVALADGRVMSGTRLLRGADARSAATEIVSRITARGGDTSRVITEGDLFYVASTTEADRTAVFHSAIKLLAQPHDTPADAMTAWSNAAYLLYQAPRRKRGSDATIRTFLIAAGTALLGYPPVLLHDIDLNAYTRPAWQFVSDLRGAQHNASMHAAP